MIEFDKYCCDAQWSIAQCTINVNLVNMYLLLRDTLDLVHILCCEYVSQLLEMDQSVH